MSLRKIFEVSGVNGSTPTATLKTGSVLTVPSGTTLNVAGTFNITGTTTFDDIILDNIGRISTGSAAGSSVAIDASTDSYAEGMELRWHMEDWADVATFTEATGMYLRMENRESNSSGSIYGAQIYGVSNNVANTQYLWGAICYAYIKGAAGLTATGVYAFQPEITFDEATASSTITEAAVVRAKITGGTMADYTTMHGYKLIAGDMNGGSRTYGNAIWVIDDSAMSGTCGWTIGLNLAATCTTGVHIESSTSAITFGLGDGKIVDAASSLSVYGGNTSGDSLVLYGSSADSGQKITVLGNSGTTITGAVKLDGTVTLDDDGTIADASNVTTITQNTINLVGGTAIGLQGNTTVTGTLKCDGTVTLDDDATLADASGQLTVTQDAIALIGKIEIGGETDWGTGATGIAIDGSGWDWVSQTVGRVNANLNSTAAAAAYLGMTVTASQTTTNSVFGLWSELYIAGATVDLTGSSNYASVWGNLEITSTTGTSTDSVDFMAGVHASITTPANYTNATSFCGFHADSNVSSSGITNTGRFSAFECKKVGSTRAWDYGLYAANTTYGIYIGAPATAGIVMPGGASYNPIHIGTKSDDADAGLILTGVTNDTGGIMVFCDDGGDALSSVTSPIWTRYLITKTDQSSGSTATGAYLQMKTLTGMTMNTGSYTAAKVFNQIGGTLTLTNGGECAIINAGMSLQGNVTNTSGRISGIDININGAYTITDTIADSAGLHIRKVSGSTAVWPMAINIASGACTAGIVMGAKSSSAAIGHHIGIANSADTAGDKAIAVFCDDGNATLASDAQGINSRCLILHAQAGSYAMDALRGHLRGVANVTPNAQKSFSATSGYAEFSGTYTIGDGSNAVFMCGMSTTVELGGTPTIAANSRICGILVNGAFTSAINGDTAPSVGVMYQKSGETYGYQFALGFHDGVSGMLSTGTDSANVTHKVAVWINGIGTRYLHLFSD